MNAKSAYRSRLLAMLFSVSLVFSAHSSVFAQDSYNTSPYETDLMRLAEIMGALQALRPLCDINDTPSWRDHMLDLLNSESKDEKRKRRFIERFNQGYRGYASVYRSCTTSARLAMTSYMEEGLTLIRNVTSRYTR